MIIHILFVLQGQDIYIGLNLIVGLQIDQILNGTSLRSLVPLGDVIHLQPKTSPFFGKEEQSIMHRCVEKVFQEIVEAVPDNYYILANLGAVLAAHGMGVGNLVKMTVFLTDASQIPAWRRQRDAFLGSHAPTSTLLIVAGLASPAFAVEVEGEAVG